MKSFRDLLAQLEAVFANAAGADLAALQGLLAAARSDFINVLRYKASWGGLDSVLGVWGLPGVWRAQLARPAAHPPARPATAPAPQGPSADSRAQIQSRAPLTPAGQVVLDEEPDVREVGGRASPAAWRHLR